MKNNFNILIVDDEEAYRNTLSIILTSKGYDVEIAKDGYEALEIIKKVNVNLMITDLKMPKMGGASLIKECKANIPDLEIIVLTAYGTIESAVDLMKQGTTGYYVKSEDLEPFLMDIDRIAQIHYLSKENDILKRQIPSSDAFLETKNKKFKSILDMCEKASKSNINVLLLGESGVGKEVIAKHIHNLSDRKNNHFIPVNCQSFAEGTITSELFGHEKGAFTGAVNKRIGKFEEANYGTIFLDEIGDLHLDTQARLLRTIENRYIERVGSNKQIALDIRIISATNKDLEQLIKEELFREDLFYRINTLTITIPPLRERREDLPYLIEFMIKKIEDEQKRHIIHIDDSVMSYLLKYDYPGNVRELKNILERLIVLSENGKITQNTANLVNITNETVNYEGDTLREARRSFEKKFISEALYDNDWNVAQTAKQIGITQRQLWNKISEFELKA